MPPSATSAAGDLRAASGPSGNDSFWNDGVVRYLTALAAVGAACGLFLVIDWLTGDRMSPYILYYPVIMLVALFIGLGPGLFAVALSALAAAFLGLSPYLQFTISRPIDIVSLSLFVVVGVGICVVAELYRRSRARGSAYRQALAVRESEARLRAESEALLRRYELIVGDSRDIILFMDAQSGSILEANQAAIEAYGYSRAELLGLTIRDLRVASAELVSSQMAEADAQGLLFETVHRRRDDSEFPVEVSSRGTTIGDTRTLVSVVRDITERKRTEETNQRLHEAEVEARKRAAAELETTRMLLQAATAMAAWTELPQLLDGLVSVVARSGDHSRVQLGLWHEDASEFEVAAATGSGAWPPGTRHRLADMSDGVRRVLKTHVQAVLDMEAVHAQGGRSTSQPDAHLTLVAPLVYRDRLVGILTIDEPGARRDFPLRELELVQGITAQASVAIESARLYEAQRRIAQTLQQHFIHPLPQVEGLELAVMSAPARTPELIGGDFHDVFELPQGLVAVLIGDVEGKGVQAAGLAERVRSAVRALATVSPSPRYVLNNVNRMLLTEDGGQFVTVLLMVADPVRGMTHAASAGHPPAVCQRADLASAVLDRFGPPLGAFEWDYEQTSFRLRPGDALVAYTDGVSEARRGRSMFGEQGVLAVVRECAGEPPTEIVRRLRDAALAFAGELHDDLQIVALRFEGRPADEHARIPAEQVLHLTVPNAPWHLMDVRGSVRDFLLAHDVEPSVVADLVLCVEEACTNTLQHSRCLEPAELGVTVRDETVEITVRDHGCGMDTDALALDEPPDLLAPGGRGLYLIRSLSDSMELRSDDGLLVTFSKRAPA